MDSIRVLYVEDDPTDRELTIRHMCLHATDLHMQVAASACAAREVLADQQFDLALLDYRLPDLDGMQLLQEIQVDHPDLPVIMVTGSGSHDLAVAALKSGAIDYVTKKPGYLNRLPTVIRETLQRFRFERNRRTGSVRILYAEHDPIDVELTLRYLATYHSHLTVEAVGTGEAAIQALATRPYDLILLDYRMPDVNGLEILHALREREIRLPVVMVTGHGDEETAVAALKLGASDYIVKRAGYLTQLPSTIESAVARWALAEEKEALLILNGLARTIASTLDLNEVLQRMALAAGVLLKTDYSLVSLLGEDDNELIPVAWSGWPAEVAGCLRFRLGEGVVGRAAVLRRVVSGLEGLPEGTDCRTLAMLQGQRRVMRLSAPIVHDRLLGTLSVAAAALRTFRVLDEKLLTDLAAYAAIGIEKARTHTELEQAAERLEATVEARTRELQTTNARLQEAMRQAQEASRHKSDFLAHMTHELRTPLNSILGFSELLQAGTPGLAGEKQTRFLHNIHESGSHLLQLINDLLDLSKVEAGKLDLWPEAFVLADALSAVVDQLRAQADAKGVTLSLQVEQAPELLTADPLRFKQILYNLLSNAVKFTPTGGAVTVTARRGCRGEGVGGNDFVDIAVSDTGIGIKAEDLGRLFQEFSQLGGSLTKTYEGTGLGLALTRRLVEMHGGTITAASPGEGQGSTFTVTLPLRPPRTHGRVLLVEEEAQLGAQIAVTLQKAGFGVDLVGDGEAALAQAEHVPPDMVILDFALSGLPGVEVLRRLHAEGFPHLPTLVLVTRAGGPVQEALALGAEAFLVKPVSLGLLTDAVKRLLGRVEAEGGAAPARANTHTVH